MFESSSNWFKHETQGKSLKSLVLTDIVLMIELKCQIQFSQKSIFLMYFYTWHWVEKKFQKVLSYVV